MDERFAQKPGAIVMATWSLAAPKRTTADGRDPEPDRFDVLRESFKGTLSKGSTLDDLLLAFTAARAGVREGDGEYGSTGVVECARHFESAPPRFDWTIPWPERARRLASPVPITPTGATYIDIDLRGKPPGARLRIEVEWEQHARMRWAAWRIRTGGPPSLFLLPSYDKGTGVQATLADLEDASRVVLFGVGLGEPYAPFDPDTGPWEPHGYLLTLAPE
jgi:hypothetical protein